MDKEHRGPYYSKLGKDVDFSVLGGDHVVVERGLL